VDKLAERQRKAPKRKRVALIRNVVTQSLNAHGKIPAAESRKKRMLVKFSLSYENYQSPQSLAHCAFRGPTLPIFAEGRNARIRGTGKSSRV